MSFRTNLKQLMEIRDITTKELSYKTGLKESTISSYLRTNGAMPTADKAVKIAEALGTSVDILVNGIPAGYKIRNSKKTAEFIKNLERIPEETRGPIIRMIHEMEKTYSEKRAREQQQKLSEGKSSSER